MPKRRVIQASAITEPQGLLIKQGQGGEDYLTAPIPYHLQGIPPREAQDYYITELYHQWIDECRAAKSFAPSKPNVVFYIAFKLGLEYAQKQDTMKGSSYATRTRASKAIPGHQA